MPVSSNKTNWNGFQLIGKPARPTVLLYSEEKTFEFFKKSESFVNSQKNNKVLDNIRAKVRSSEQGY